MRPRRPRRARARLALLAGFAVLPLVVGCESEPDPRTVPDTFLRDELGLGDDDVVHTVTITGGEAEVAEPALDSIVPGAWVQFRSGDWRVHEVVFELDSLSAGARAFLVESGQSASPPLLQLDARFLVSFEGAPPGRYPYRLEGNTRPGGGAIVVSAPPR